MTRAPPMVAALALLVAVGGAAHAEDPRLEDRDLNLIPSS